MRALSCHVRIAGLTAALALYLSAAMPAAASKPPLVLSPAFTENEGDVTVAPAKGTSVCTVHFTDVTDARRDKLTVGVVYNRSVQSPDDTQAWMRSILGGLARRGVTPEFDTPAAADGSAAEATPAPAAPTAKFSLQMVWLTGAAIDLSANTVVTIDATGADGHSLQKTYRGAVARMNWASGSNEMQVAINKAFSDALNKMAPDLAKLCPSS